MLVFVRFFCANFEGGREGVRGCVLVEVFLRGVGGWGGYFLYIFAC